MADPAPNSDISIETMQDGSVVIDLQQRRPQSFANPPPGTTGFDENLANSMDKASLMRISDDLLRGIDADIQSRQNWVNNYNEGLKLLSVMLEQANQAQKTSRVRSTLLLQAIIKFQSQARGELLPTVGPVKVRNDSQPTSPIPQSVAQAIEDDENHYLTTTASEYYPDTDRGLFYLGYGGTIFKKVYNDPIRERTVSECVYLPDLIISNDATDLRNASRVTHIVQMSRNQIRQLIDAGYFADIDPGQAMPRPSTTQTATSTTIGVTVTPTLPQDIPNTMCECYCNLDLGQYGEGLREKGQSPGTTLPYRVTIEKDTRQVFEMRRNWREDDKKRFARRRFVKWGLVPGIGYLDLGYLNLLGNQALAATALLRILVDAGIYGLFPGGVRVKGSRMETNEVRPGPGEFPELDLGGLNDIRSAIMPLPYKTPDAIVLQLLQYIDAQADKTSGQVELPTGQGRSNIPVGTILALIEQDTQIIVSVHQRLHTAQQEELELIRECQAELPNFWEVMGYDEDETKPYTLEQFTAARLVPASDPNTPAYIHRVMRSTALEMLAQRHPEMYNQYEVQRELLTTLKIPNIDQILIPPQPPMPPPPDPTIQIAQMQAQIEMQKAQTDAQDKAAHLALDQKKLMLDTMLEHAKLQQDAQKAQMEAQLKAQAAQQDSARKAQEAQMAADEEEQVNARKTAADQAEFMQSTRQSQVAAMQRNREAEMAATAQAREAELDRESKERIAAMQVHSQLILKGVESLQSPEPVPTKEDKSG